jgi:hypothetical protein
MSLNRTAEGRKVPKTEKKREKSKENKWTF